LRTRTDTEGVPLTAPNDEDAAKLVATHHALRDADAKFRVLADAMPQMVWSTLPDGFHDYYNARWYEFTGMAEGSTDGEEWNGMFHPDDQERAWSRWRKSLETGEPYEIEYRLRHHSGAYRWTLGRALPIRNADGTITRWMGTCTDIDDAKRTSEQTEILSRELSHRIKNIFAVIGGLIGLSARRFPEAKDYAHDLQGRVAALAKAHEFVRPHSEQSAPVIGASTLHTMLRDLFAPYLEIAEDRMTIAGPDVAIDDRGATPVALVFHELATNAAKYGALSTPDGRVSIETETGDADGALLIAWRETGGPLIAGAPVRQGFGTKLAELSITQQLGGTITRDWAADGLKVSMTIPANRLTRN
jgi:PAS domain S-box-containing protein